MDDDLIELGRTAGAYGFRGWVRIVPFESGEVLEAVRDWVLIDKLGGRTNVVVKGFRRHGEGFLAKWDGCDSKEAADALRVKVGVPRSAFPDAGENAVWAIDLVGCRVVNREGEDLGVVADIGTNGAQDLLMVDYEGKDGKTARFMIPNVKDVYVLDIDVDQKRVSVDWPADWR